MTAHRSHADAECFRQLIKEDLGSASPVAQAVAALRDAGPTLGRPLVDRLKGSDLHHLKELRPGSGGRSEIRIIFAFDPTPSALLLLGGGRLVGGLASSTSEAN
ncbi:type II toxin-antitoxin system RelE/ParE family toxin [Streptomyces sp. NPDC005820]|uniref:type II toxin-antitoxin system RelE/ParE family toxin n=1 Tax=Streptomyces sp. NPDC005820 TaxID=3157069 RepID=UPI00340D4E19